MTLLPGGVGAGFPHPALLIGVVIIVVSGEGVLAGLGEEEGEELQLAASSAQSAPRIHHESSANGRYIFVSTLDMLCITCSLMFHFPFKAYPLSHSLDPLQPAWTRVERIQQRGVYLEYPGKSASIGCHVTSHHFPSLACHFGSRGDGGARTCPFHWTYRREVSGSEMPSDGQ